MNIKTTLYRQLVSIVIIICGLLFLSLGLILPNLLIPIYEKQVYNYLKQPLEVITDESYKNDFDDIAYIYNKDTIKTSDNLYDVIPLSADAILKNIKGQSGKFTYLGKTYYYYTLDYNIISITSDNHLLKLRSDILLILIPLVLIVLLIAISLVILWTRTLIKKIEILKEKVENINNDDYKEIKFKVDDELTILSDAIDDMKITLKKQEEYKNQMYQNISHDFKTPLTVMKSYCEAITDGIVTTDVGINVIKEQIDKLNYKVHSLLYLNKLIYLKENTNYKNELIDVKSLIENSISKFKLQNQNINYVFNYSGNTKFLGTYDMWEAITDNLLNNFIRYAKKEIKITIKNNKIIFYNDGEKIDPKILSSIFTPYKKGINGQFGLGLSIVKNTLALLGYEISVKNEKKGVSFIIK